MALTAKGNAVPVLFMNLALYRSEPSADVFGQQVTKLDTGFFTPALYANQAVDIGFGTLTNSALATLVLGNLLGFDASNNAALQTQVAAALAANPGNRGVVVLQLAQLLSSLEGDATYGQAAFNWNLQVNNQYQHLVNTAPVARTYVLTTGVDAPVAGDADDTFVGTDTTLQPGDRLDGGGGYDTLRVASSGDKTVQLAGITTVSVERLVLTSDASGGTRISAAGMADTTLLTNDNSSSNVSFTDVGRLTSLMLQNVSGGNTSVAFAPDVVKGNNDTLNVTLQNNLTIAGQSIGSLTANGIEVMNITTIASSGAGASAWYRSILSEIASPCSLAVLNISGNQDLSVGKVDFFGANNTGVVNASQLTGKLTLGLGTQGGVEQNLIVNGGTNTDTLRLPGTRADYTVTLGGGKETIPHLHNVHASADDRGNINISSLERLQFSDQSLALDMLPTRSGGMALEMLGAVLGPSGLTDKASAGWLLARFDQGATLLTVAQMLLDNGYLIGKAGAANAGDVSAIVRYVYANVNGQAPLADALPALLAPITGHTVTLAQWVANMAASSENQTHVQLTGYLGTGLAYI